MDKPLYVGSGKEIRRDGRDPMIAVELDLDELKQKMTPDLVRTWRDAKGNDRRVLKLILAPLKPENVTNYRTHSLKIDTWKPDGNSAENKPSYQRQQATISRSETYNANPEEIDAVPF